MDVLGTPKTWELVDRLLMLAIDEDIGPQDATTVTLIPENASLQAAYVSRAEGIVSGLEVAARFFQKLNPDVIFTASCKDGDPIRSCMAIATVKGPARSVLTGERISLNLLQRMSGIATLTHSYIDKVSGTKAKILDTRKTTPGLRILEKMAVVHGGGTNHRMGLYDMVLVKDNHLPLISDGKEAEVVGSAVSIRNAILLTRERSALPVMVEVDTMQQYEEALACEPDFILLDNMSPDTMNKAVLMADEALASGKKRPQLEASGGINLDTVRAAAESGVDRISVGALTHSAIALDIGLDYLNAEK